MYYTTSIAIVAGLCLAFGTLHLALALQGVRSRTRNLLFALFALTYAGSILFARSAYLADLPSDFLDSIRVSWAFGLVGSSFLIWYVSLYTGFRPRIQTEQSLVNYQRNLQDMADDRTSQLEAAQVELLTRAEGRAVTEERNRVAHELHDAMHGRALRPDVVIIESGLPGRSLDETVDQLDVFMGRGRILIVDGAEAHEVAKNRPNVEEFTDLSRLIQAVP